MLTTYKYDGTPTTPTITDSIDDPHGVAVDRNGKIYVANLHSGLVTTYDRFGNRTNPTIDVLPMRPAAVAVDANGKIYVGAGNMLTTWNPDGSQTTPTIALDPKHRGTDISGVAVDANGKIYVASLQSHKRCVSSYNCRVKSLSRLTTYNADGSHATPSIRLTAWYHSVAALVGGPAIDANGKIYVVTYYGDTLRTYRPAGSRTKPIIRGLPSPSSVAVDASGKVYVTNVGHNTLTTYTRNGSPTTPTISGLDDPSGVALH